MTYLWVDGDPVLVETDELGLPLRLTWNSKRHPVSGIANRWRVDEGWWFQRVWREYFKLTTSSGMLLTIFRDMETDEWYVQRLYD
jgi:hypothetical protein